MKWIHPEFGAKDKSVSEQYLCDYAVSFGVSYTRLLQLLENPFFTTDEKVLSHYKVIRSHNVKATNG